MQTVPLLSELVGRADVEGATVAFTARKTTCAEVMIFCNTISNCSRVYEARAP